MIQLVSDGAPRIFFVHEADRYFYFKEEFVMPDEMPDKPENIAEEDAHSGDFHYLVTSHFAMKSAGVLPGGRLSDRIIATSCFSDMLGISHMISRTWRESIIYQGKKLSGVGMEAAKGIVFKNIAELPEYKEKRLYYTPEVVRDLINMTQFDLICGQTDRHSKNIKLSLEEENEGKLKVTAVKAIDHDMSFGTLKYEKIRKNVSIGCAFCPELFGELVYPAIDEEFFEKVRSLNEQGLHEAFSDLLTKEELEALWDRLSNYLEVIIKAKSDGRYSGRFMKDMDDWRELLSRLEDAAVCGRRDPDLNYHATYLKAFILRHDEI